MSEFHRLTDQKYSEAEYLFQTIEMAKSDEEFNVDLCSTPPSHTDLELDLMYNDLESSMYSWKLVKHRRPRRRYTVSHGGGSGSGGGGGAGVNGHHATINICANGGSGGGGGSSFGGSGGLPPAPPSTPTSLTPTNTSLSSSLPNSGVGGLVTDEEQQRLDSLLYILDYAPKYKKKLKEQQRTDAELAELFNVVSITSSSASSSTTSKTKIQPERGVSATSRTIRKHDPGTTKIFKIHRNLQESFQERDEEDSVSAPEYDTEEEDTRFHRLGRIKPSHRLTLTKRQRRFARFEHAERMEAMVDIFDEAMTFNET